MVNKVQRLLVGIDEILDTRAGTLILIDPKQTAKLMHETNYSCRIIDQFENIDNEQFKKLYEQRDSRTLRVSMLTHVYRLIQDFIHRVMNRNFNSPFEVKAEIHINTYPYQLSDPEKDLIVKGLRSKLPYQADIFTVHYSPKELSPQLIKKLYGTVIMYNFLDWIDLQAEDRAIEKTPIPEVSFFAPCLVKKIDKDFPKDIQGFFTDLMFYFQFHANVIFIPVDTFCSLMAKNLSLSTPKSEEGELDDEIPPTESENFDLHWT